MDIVMRSSTEPFQLSDSNYIGLIGEAIDDRGRAAEEFIRKHAKDIIKLEYFPDRHLIAINGENEIIVDDFPAYFKATFGNAKKILVESTTLSFPEIFICARTIMLEKMGCELSFLYLEPGEYKKVDEDKSRRDFDLSEECGSFLSIPGAAVNIDDLNSVKKGIFFVGYEGNRLDRIYEELEKKPAERCIVVFGVPAFKSGWEMNSFSKNINVMKARSLNDGIEFTPANNPNVAYQILCNHFTALSDMEKMFVSPLGTKPASIGAALFIARMSLNSCGPKAGILFDNPRRKPDRSSDINKWHIYTVRQ